MASPTLRTVTIRNLLSCYNLVPRFSGTIIGDTALMTTYHSHILGEESRGKYVIVNKLNKIDIYIVKSHAAQCKILIRQIIPDSISLPPSFLEDVFKEILTMGLCKELFASLPHPEVHLHYHY